MIQAHHNARWPLELLTMITEDNCMEKNKEAQLAFCCEQFCFLKYQNLWMSKFQTLSHE